MTETAWERLRTRLVPLTPLVTLFLLIWMGAGFQTVVVSLFVDVVPSAQRGAVSSFAAVSWLLLVVQGVAIIFALNLLCSGDGDHGRRRLGLLFALVACVAVLLFPAGNYMPVTMTLLKQRVAEDCPAIIDVVVIQERVGFCAAALLSLSVCMLLLRTWPEDREAAVRVLSERLQVLSMILYAGTVLLVASVLRLAALDEWIVVSNPGDKTLASQAAGELRVWGVFYTTLLATIFLPSYFLFRQRADRVAGEEVTPAAREEWLTKRGLKLNFPDALPRMVAVLAPILAGEASKLLHVFG